MKEIGRTEADCVLFADDYKATFFFYGGARQVLLIYIIMLHLQL